MILTATKARAGLSAYAATTRTNIVGSNRIGPADRVITFTGQDVVYSLQALVCIGSDLVLDQAMGTTATSDAWVAGAGQIETATAAGSITTAGNLSCIVTAAGMAGSPKTVTVAVALNDTASQWAEKVRVGLAADTTVNGRFVVSGSGTAIILTRRPLATLTFDGVAVPIYYATDGTLNMALADVTSAGCTEAATSAATVAGTATSGCLIQDGEGLDHQGETLPEMVNRFGLEITAEMEGGVSRTGIATTGDSTIPALIETAGGFLHWSTAGIDTFAPVTFTPPDEPVILTITVLGKSS